MILATYRTGDHLFALSDEDMNFMDHFPDKFSVVFSLTGPRSHCNADLLCSQCPFAASEIFIKSNNDTCQVPLVARDPKYLALFGFTPELYPELFI